MLKKSVIAAFLAATAVWAAPASALTFCPNGNNVGCVSFNVIDQAVGNAIGFATVATAPSPVTNTANDFNVFYQANLSVLQNVDPNTGVKQTTFTNGTAVNQFFTFVLGYQEHLTSNTTVGGSSTNLTFDYSLRNDNAINNSAADPNFFYMYNVPTPGGIDLSGTNFVPGAPGAPPNPILSGHTIAESYVATFNTTGLATPDPTECPTGALSCLDQGGANGPGTSADGTHANKDNYSGVQTVGGAGSVTIKIVIDSFNPNYFPDLPAGLRIIFDTNTSTNLPYEEIDPSAKFSSTGINDANINGVANVGPVNGLGGASLCAAGGASLGGTAVCNGTATMFQADANSSLVVPLATVPEPATLTLLGFGLLGAAARRRSRKK